MQYTVYRNPGNSRAYPYLLDIQSDIIGELNTRTVIPFIGLKRSLGPGCAINSGHTGGRE